jgi:SET domain-containing protein
MSLKIYPPDKVYVAPSQIHGFGVFAKCDIGKDEIIEECPIISIGKDCGEFLARYRFAWPNGTGSEVSDFVIPAGYGAIYNHSNNNNATWKSSEIRGTFFFYAIKDIKKDEEILTCYGNSEYWEALGFNVDSVK